MDYEKKYKKALEKVKIWQNHLYEVGDKDYADELNYIFPELQESEDERIRKNIITYLKQRRDRSPSIPAAIGSWIAWLEKQSEKLPPGFYYVNSEGKKFYSDTFKYGDVILHVEKQGEQKPIIDEILTATNYDKMFQNCKLGEQKETLCDKCRKVQPSHSCQDITALGRCYIEGINTSNNVKPKFKVGDWIISTLPGIKYPHLITDIQDGYYIFGEDDDYTHIASNDDVLKLWTIQDAKDGDVLYCDNGNNKTIYLFKEQRGLSNIANTHFQVLNMNNELRLMFNKAADFNLNTKPATKEQRDLLFQKIHEEGYMWDSESKQLLSLKVEPSGEQRSAWSEEDEKRLKSCLNILQAKGMMGVTNTINTKWLKSLKERCTWKPSAAQMASITCAVRKMKESACYDSELVSLLNDLKKLKGE